MQVDDGRIGRNERGEQRGSVRPERDGGQTESFEVREAKREEFWNFESIAVPVVVSKGEALQCGAPKKHAVHWREIVVVMWSLARAAA